MSRSVDVPLPLAAPTLFSFQFARSCSLMKSSGVLSAALILSASLSCLRPVELPELELEEVASAGLPSGTEIQGAVFGDGDIFLWGAESLWRWRLSTGELEPLCAGLVAHTLTVIWDSTRHQLLTIDRAPTGARVVDARGSCMRLTGRVARAVESVLAAGGAADYPLLAVSEKQLIILHLQRNAVPVASMVSLSDGVVSSVRIGRGAMRLGDPSGYIATADRNGVGLTEAAFPFRTVSIDKHGSQRHVLDPMRNVRTEVRTSFIRGWFCLRILEVSPAMLMVMAEPASDRRALVVLDSSGEVLRIRYLDVALGILAAEPASHHLAAVRDIGVREVVLYRWRWRGEYN